MTVAENVKVLLPPGAFRTDDHRYYFNGEGPVPGVTSILDTLSKDALIRWLAMEAVKAVLRAEQLPSGEEADIVKWAIDQAYENRDRAGRLGTSVHLLADMAPRASESDEKGIQVSDEVKPYLEAFRGFLGRYSASSIVSSEKMVWSLNGYGGTYDLLMQMESDGTPELWLVDIKTSGKGPYPEWGLQLAAYRWADSIILEGDPRLYPMPSIQRTGVLHLRPDLYTDTGWRLIEYPTTYEKDYMAFLGALEVYKWKKEGRFTKSRLRSTTIGS